MSKLEQYRTYVEQIEAVRRDHTLSPQDYIDLFDSIDWSGMVQELLPIAEAAEVYKRDGDFISMHNLFDALIEVEGEEQS